MKFKNIKIGEYFQFGSDQYIRTNNHRDCTDINTGSITIFQDNDEVIRLKLTSIELIPDNTTYFGDIPILSKFRLLQGSGNGYLFLKLNNGKNQNAIWLEKYRGQVTNIYFSDRVEFVEEFK